MKNSISLAVITLLLAVSSVAAATRYVWQDSPNPGPPYTNWVTGARVIQDAVDVAQSGDTVLVAGGVYATGGRAVGTNLLVNRLAIDRPITVESLMGPEVTVIQGYLVPGTTNGDGAIRCVYLTNGAVLSGFTLTNGATRAVSDYPAYRESSGGGVWCESTDAVVSNCVLVGNSARIQGGGTCLGTLKNCTLSGNSAPCGGGAADCKLYNCTLSGNSASNCGGGASASELIYCTLVGNSADVGAGGGASCCVLNRCVLTGNLAAGGGGACASRLYDCTLTTNSTRWLGEGGGASWSTLDHCILAGNSAGSGGGAICSSLDYCTLTGNSAGSGGGAHSSVLNNCLLIGNSAESHGGGVAGGTAAARLKNCTLVGNSAGEFGGGACFNVELTNCIVYLNIAPNGPNYSLGAEFSASYFPLNYCCTTPMPTNGFGNITSTPLFVDYPRGDLRLQSNSPCINAGNNLSLTNYEYDFMEDTPVWFTNVFDLDGNPRIVSGTVDIGAYEYQGLGSIISYAWLQQYGLPTDGSADFLDPDADGHNNWQEWRCQTCPTNALSALRLLPASSDGADVTVTWQSVPGVVYFLERSTNLSASPPFTLRAPNLPGQPGTTTYTDTNAASLAPLFYRVAVGN